MNISDEQDKVSTVFEPACFLRWTIKYNVDQMTSYIDGISLENTTG